MAAITDCRSASMGDAVELSINFDINNASSAITPGTVLATARSNLFGINCIITGDNNAVYFKNMMPENIKAMLIQSGVDVTLQQNIGSGEVVTITNPVVPLTYIGTWGKKPDQPDIGIGLRYSFTVMKGQNALKPFDTGFFLLGHHVDSQGNNIGGYIYLRIVGKLTLLCPSPMVNISSSNGGVVDFGMISPAQMNNGQAISKSFTLGLTVPPECQTGLNISVRFEPNGNAVLGDKYLDMGNGLQMLLRDGSTDIHYEQPYVVGEVLPMAPVNIPYTAILSKIPGANIASGSFSRTIRVIVSY